MKEPNLLDLELLYADYKENENTQRETEHWVAKQLREGAFTQSTSQEERLEAWLGFQSRHRWFEGVSIGARVFSWLALLRFLLFMGGALLGGAAMMSCVAGGAVSIPSFLFLGAVVPFVFTLLLLYFLIPARGGSCLPIWARDMIFPLVRWAGKGVSRVIPTEQRVDWAARMGRVMAAKTDYNRLISLRMSAIFQSVGLGYALSMGGCFFYVLMGQVLSFSWETSLTEFLTPENWCVILNFVSLGISGVSIEMLRSSEMQLAVEYRHVWGVFFLSCLLIWAVLPRLFAMLLTRFLLSRECKRHDFSALYYHELTHALTPPREEGAAPSAARVSPVMKSRSLVLLSADCVEDKMPGMRERVIPILENMFSRQLKAVILAESLLRDPEQNWRHEVENYIERYREQMNVFVLEPIWKPNVKGALEKWVKTLRDPDVINHQGDIAFITLGEEASGVQNTARPEYRDNWKNNLDSISDRRLNLYHLN